MKKTTITISQQHKSKLDAIGKKSESYDQIIDRLLQDREDKGRYQLREHAREYMKKYTGNSQKEKLHRKILQDIADGKSRSWESIKEEILRDNVQD